MNLTDFAIKMKKNNKDNSMRLNFSPSEWDNLYYLLHEGASNDLLINALSFQVIINEMELSNPTQEDLSSKEFIESELLARKEFALEDRDNIVDSVMINIKDVDYMDIAGNIWMDSVGRYKISLADLHYTIFSDEIKNIDWLVTDNNPAEITHHYRENSIVSMDDFIKGRGVAVLSDGKSAVNYDTKNKKVNVECSNIADISDDLEEYKSRFEAVLSRAVEDVYRKNSIGHDLAR